MRATFYSTRKRINSFENPETSYLTKTVFDNVYFKDNNISMTTPRLYIASGNFPETAYCVIDNFGATNRPPKLYYFVRNIDQDHQNRWYVDLQLDVLLTYKDSILSQSAFIERSASHFNPMIIDNALPLSNNIKYDKISSSTDTVIDNEDGCWLFIFRGSSQANVSTAGGVSAFILDSTQVAVLGFELNAPATIQLIRNTLGDLQSGIGSLKFIPFPKSQIATHPQAIPIKISDVSLNVTGYPLQAGVSYTRTHVFSFGTKRRDYRDTSFATRFRLFLPGVGMVDISGEDYVATSDSLLYVQSYMDVVTGTICYQVSITSDETQAGGGSYRIGDFNANVATEIPIATFSRGNPVKAIGNIISAAGLAIGAVNFGMTAAGKLNAMGGGMLMGAGTKLGGALYNTFAGSGTMVGGFEGAMTYKLGRKIVLYKMINDTSMDPALIASTLGRPCYQIHQLSALSGYTKTQNFHLQNSGYMTIAEQESVENMFNNEGVFI